jgi:beta-1,4-glucosyltransferase
MRSIGWGIDVRVLGLEAQALDTEVAATQIEHLLRSGTSDAVLLHANLNTAHTADLDPDLRRSLQSTRSIVLFEGIGLKAAAWLGGGRWLPDTNGTDLVPATLARLSDMPLRVALVGGEDGVARGAGLALQRRFPQVTIVGTWNGFADRVDEDALVAELRAARPDVLLLGLGTPVQEVLAVDWSARSGARLTWAVGGLLDYFAGARQRAPGGLRALRLEWLWRVFLYPSTYGRRYAVQGLWLARRLAKAAVLRSRHRPAQAAHPIPQEPHGTAD